MSTTTTTTTTRDRGTAMAPWNGPNKQELSDFVRHCPVLQFQSTRAARRRPAGPGRAPAAGVNNMRPRAESDVNGHRFFRHRTVLERRRPAERTHTRTATRTSDGREGGRRGAERGRGTEILPLDTAAERTAPPAVTSFVIGCLL